MVDSHSPRNPSIRPVVSIIDAPIYTYMSHAAAMETLPNDKQLASHPTPRDPSDFDSTPRNKQMSKPQLVMPSVATGRMKRKLAAGLASLYDTKDKSSEQTPIIKSDTIDVKQSTEMADFVLPDGPSPAPSNMNISLPQWTHAAGVMDSISSATETEDGMDNDTEEDSDGEAPAKPIQPEWVGTSQFFIEQNIEWQENGTFDSLILYLKAIEHDLSQSPYDPTLYLDYTQLVNKIGFTDIGTASAHRALILIEGYLNQDPRLYRPVRRALIRRFGSSRSPYIIEDEVQQLQLQAYRDLLNGLLGCACFWEGLAVAREALTVWPRDPELLELRQWLKEGFTDRHTGLKDLGAETDDLVVLTRMGRIYQKSYPWIAADLYKRKPALVREVNKNFRAGNCEVRPVVFGPVPSTPQLSPRAKENENVGPLGIFATRDIKEGELVLVDQCVTAVSNIPSSRLEHCDACHASLKMPFLSPSEIIKPSCCNTVAYCSRACYEIAKNGYHSELCGKDFDWLYDATGNGGDAGGAGYKWRKVMFLRIISMCIADRRKEIKNGQKPTHPLQHPVIARMAANYASPNELHPGMPNDWQYSENVVAPTKILMLLGIDIFTEADFSQEVIQTIYWRMENNANMSIVDLFSGPQPKTQAPSLSTRRTAQEKANKNKIYMICLNPQYLFFNHSCEPNISWHGAIPNVHVGMEWITGYNGEILKPGSSAVFCKAFRDIKSGEELKISYVGDPKGTRVDKSKPGGAGGREGKRAWLEKWFEGGCGCDLCVKENLEQEAKERNAERMESMDVNLDVDVVGKLEGQI